MSSPLDLPIRPEIHDEPIRPLLAVLDHTARATLLALGAKYPEDWPEPDYSAEPPLDGAEWVETALAVQIEGLLRILEVHDRPLRERHRLRSHDF